MALEVSGTGCAGSIPVGNAQLHDVRRTRRTVQAATHLAENPLGSLPAQMHTWKETKALYRLLDEPDVTFAALMQPHMQQTREQAISSATKKNVFSIVPRRISRCCLQGSWCLPMDKLF